MNKIYVSIGFIDLSSLVSFRVKFTTIWIFIYFLFEFVHIDYIHMYIVSTLRFPLYMICQQKHKQNYQFVNCLFTQLKFCGIWNISPYLCQIRHYLTSYLYFRKKCYWVSRWRYFLCVDCMYCGKFIGNLRLLFKLVRFNM